MVIKQSAFRKLLDACPSAPPELGGLLGSAQEGVIDNIYIDAGSSRTDCFQYTPDTAILNAVISEWADAGISFLGIWHTHPVSSKGLGLSGADKDYIASILYAMPEETSGLYFPIVFPEHGSIDVFWARRGREGIEIEAEALTITD